MELCTDESGKYRKADESDTAGNFGVVPNALDWQKVITSVARSPALESSGNAIRRQQCDLRLNLDHRVSV
jgi:hypothetical protein